MNVPEVTPPSISGTIAARIGRYRWVICALIFCAITLNTMDRLVFSVLAPELRKIFGWTNTNYTNIAFWFEVAYGIGFAVVGRFLDTVGTRKGFMVALGGWSLASAMHAMMQTIPGFSFARFCLGLTESGAFPSAVKVTAEWFPKKERAFVAGIVGSGSSLGAILAPIVVPWLYLTWGWQWAFITTGALGSIWLVAWWAIYRLPHEHPKVSPAELAYIRADSPSTPTTKIPLREVFRTRQAWAFIGAKFFSDAVWRWYLYLLPLFFNQAFKLDIRNFGLPFLIIYLMADIGGIIGGAISSWLLRQGMSLNRARKTAMAMCVACVLPVMLMSHVSNMWVAVGLVGLATGAHQGWSANLFTTASDMFPSGVVASIVAYGSMAGSIGTMAILELTGRLFDASKGASGTGVFGTLFVIAGCAYLAAIAVFHLLAPRLEPAEFPART
jgi:ACS family hexuronate transporter-like MFS transporter